MSVVAGCVLWNHVLVTADARVSWRVGGEEGHADNALKLYRCGPFSILGFVADDVEAASRILVALLMRAKPKNGRSTQLEQRSLIHGHPLRIARWLPRFLRRAYKNSGTSKAIGFLHAYVIPGVPTMVTKQQLAGLIKEAGAAGNRTWLPHWIVPALMAAQESASGQVAIGGTLAGRLQTLESQDRFEPKTYGALDFAILGSGRDAGHEGIRTYHDMIFAGDDGSFSLDHAVESFCRRQGLTTVGGLRPTYELSIRGVRPVTTRVTKNINRPDEEEVSLSRSEGGWVQRTTKGNAEQRILPIWDAIAEIRRGGGATFDSDFF